MPEGEVRILLVGDRGVGKTSLILSLMRERFEPDSPPLTSDVTVPKDVTPERVTTHITDSSLRVEDESAIAKKIEQSDVVCLVYAVDDKSSLLRMRDHWLPLIRRTPVRGRSRPVILVGNKTDTMDSAAGDKSSAYIKDIIMPIMDTFPEAETCVECSAKTLRNLSEVFYFAQKAVLHPIMPLYDAKEHKLQPAARQALTRVFRICDTDKDDVLCDDELNAFQATVFEQTLSAEELDGIKEVIRKSTDRGVDATGVTLEGFLFLHRLFVERGRLETTWTVLRQFGYDDDFKLRPDYCSPPLDLCSDCTTELSPAGRDFLIQRFHQHDLEGKRYLTTAQMQALFEITPGIPWEDDVFFNEQDPERVTLDQYMSLWTLLCLTEPRKCLEYLAWLGFRLYNDGASTVADGITVSRSRQDERAAGVAKRNVFTCYLFGASNAGKTSLLTALAKSGSTVLLGRKERHRTAVGIVQTKEGSKYLVMKEFAVLGEDGDVVSSHLCAELCDVACFCYDQSDPNAFEYAANLQSQLVMPGPQSIFVASKADKTAVMQEYSEQPSAYCAARQLLQPIAVSTVAPDKGRPESLFAKVIEAAAKPQRGSGGASSGALATTGGLSLPVVVGGALLAGVAGYFLYKRLKQK